jgi:hypothetical protein
MTRNHTLGFVLIAALVPAFPSLAQVGTGSGRAPRPRPPYTVEFKTTHVQTLANGTTITTETKEVMARDQQMRRMTATTTMPTGDRPAITNGHVNDPNTGDQVSWNSLSKTARVVRYPVGADRTGCWASPDGHIRANYGSGNSGAGPLQPVPPPNEASLPVASPLASGGSSFPNVATGPDGQDVIMLSAKPAPGGRSAPPPSAIADLRQRTNSNNVVREDLGTDNIMGVEVRGSRTTVTTPAGAEGNDQPLVRTDELWMAPSLGMALRTISDDPRMGRTVREVVTVDLNEPDPALFQPPADYKVDTEVMQAVPCQ